MKLNCLHCGETLWAPKADHLDSATIDYWIKRAAHFELEYAKEKKRRQEIMKVHGPIVDVKRKGDLWQNQKKNQ